MKTAWLKGFLVGLLIELALFLLVHVWPFEPILRAQNSAVDSLTSLSADACDFVGSGDAGAAARWFGRKLRCPSFDPPSAIPVLVNIDTQTWRSPVWGGGEPDLAPRDRLAQLITQAFALGARQVVLDIAVQDRRDAAMRLGSSSAEDEKFAAFLQELLDQPWFASGRHLVLVRTERRPLAQDEAAFLSELKSSAAIDRVIAQSAGRIATASPYFLLGSDRTLRDWELFKVICERRAEVPEQGNLRLVPSVQLRVRAQQLNLPEQILAGPLMPDPCPAFPLTGASALGEKEALDQASALRARIGGESGESWWGRLVGALGLHSGSAGVANLRDAYWNGIRSALPSGTQWAALPTAGGMGSSIGNRIAFRFSRDNVAQLSALELLNASSAVAERYRPLFEGRTVVIGQTFDEAGDQWETPLGTMPGAMVLVNAIDSMQSHGLLKAPPAAAVLAFSIALLALVSYAFARWNSARASTIATIVVMVTAGFASVYLFAHGIWLDFVLPVIAIRVHHWLESIKKLRRKL